MRRSFGNIADDRQVITLDTYDVATNDTLSQKNELAKSQLGKVTTGLGMFDLSAAHHRQLDLQITHQTYPLIDSTQGSDRTASEHAEYFNKLTLQPLRSRQQILGSIIRKINFILQNFAQGFVCAKEFFKGIASDKNKTT